MENATCSIEQCDIFDFMANNVGLTVIHPGGLEATVRLAEACHIDENTRVLDIACGKGTSAVFLARNYGCQVVGIDISEDLVAQAANLAKRKGLEDVVSFRVADALNMPFSEHEFDVAMSQAMLILVSDKRKAVEEALRVTKPGGRLGWLELSWKKPPTQEFLQAVSNVICAYCMLGVETFEDWEKLFTTSGVSQLETAASPMEFQGMRGMVADEGFWNTCRIFYRYLTNRKIRRRMNTTNRFFKNNPEYFGYGVYTGTK